MPTPETLAKNAEREARKNKSVFDTDLAQMNEAAILGAARDATASVVGYAKAAKPASDALHAKVKETGKRNIAIGLVLVCVAFAVVAVLTR